MLVSKRSLLWSLVGLPMLMAVIYYALFAADRYVSESIITVRTAEDDGQASSENTAAGLALGLPVGGPSATDVNYLKDYIYSVDMLSHLEEKLGLRQRYEAQKWDLFFRLFPKVSQEWFLWYYRSRVEVALDAMTSTIYLKVEGFTPEDAHVINQEILAESERFINQISYRMAEEQMGYAERYLAKAQDRYQQTKDRLIDFQDRNQLFDPIAQAQAKAGLGNELEAELARQEAELRNELTYLNERSYQIAALKNRIKATSDEIEELRRRAAASEGQHLNELAGAFQRLTLDAGFAEDTYRASLSTVEKIRLETSRKLKHLVVIAKPTVPEWPLYPRRIYNLVTLLVVLTLLYGIARLIVAIIEDHRD